MGQAAHVRSLDALLELRAALQRFRSEALEALARARQRVGDAGGTLAERTTYWKRAEAAAFDRLRRARRDYERCGQDEDRSCSEEEQELFRAQREYDLAVTNRETCGTWGVRLEQEAARFERQVLAFRAMDGATVSRAVGFLEERRRDLDTYVAGSVAPAAPTSAAAPAGAATGRTGAAVGGSLTEAVAAGGVEPEGLLELVDGADREVLARRLGALDAAQTAALRRVLAHPRADAAMLARALGRPPGPRPSDLDDEMALALPGALAAILEFDPDVGGLFHRMSARGPGVGTALESFSNGKAFEILGTAKRLTLGDHPLAIRPGQHISFGPKSQARYQQHDEIARDLLEAVWARDEKRKTKRWKSYRSKRKGGASRKTVESDLHLGIRTAAGWLEIMEDYKHTRKDKHRGDFRDEILGMGVALAAGELHTARFICHKEMPERTRQQIEDVNAVLAKWAAREDPPGDRVAGEGPPSAGTIEVYDNFDWRPSR